MKHIPLLTLTALLLASGASPAAEPAGAGWQMSTPIVTCWAGPAMTDATAKQMAEGG